jgi:hypothetical protein
MKALLFAIIVLCGSAVMAQQTWTVQPRYGSWSNGYTVQRQSDPFQRAYNEWQYNFYRNLYRQINQPLPSTYQPSWQSRVYNPFGHNHVYNSRRYNR